MPARPGPGKFALKKNTVSDAAFFLEYRSKSAGPPPPPEAHYRGNCHSTMDSVLY